MAIVSIELELPGDLARFQLPQCVDARLSYLLDKQDRGEPLSIRERQEAESLVNLAETLTFCAYAPSESADDGAAVMATTLREIERQVSQLSAADKAQLLERVAREVGGVFPGIESTPGVCGGEPCIVGTRIPVWLLERARQLGSSEAELLHAYPTLSAKDIVNAWVYIDAHREVIERQISENEE